MALLWWVAGPGAAFGLKMALLWWVAGPGAAFGLKMAHVSLWSARGRDQPLRLGYVIAARTAK